IPIIVLNLTEKGNIKRAVQGKDVGTLVKEG
ncbi:MAG: UMP kinase, partial [bacterium]